MVSWGGSGALIAELAAAPQGSQREDFLRDCKRPLTNLGHWWSSVNLLLGRLPGWTPAAAAEEEHPHEE